MAIDNTIGDNNNNNNVGQSGPTFEGTLNAINQGKVSFTGTPYADYMSQMYNAGMNLQNTEERLVKNTAQQLSNLNKQAKNLFSANPSASRAETLEMDAAINNSLQEFTKNTFDNREILAKNTQRWYQGVGDLISDTSFAKVAGEQYWNSLSGSDKKKWKQMQEDMNALDDNEFFDVFFDENERSNLKKLNESKSDDDQQKFFSDAWKDAFTPSAFDRQQKRSEKGILSTALFGGNWDHPVANVIGSTLNFLVWEPLEFMTVDMVTNTFEFVGSIFDDEKGLKWGKGLEAGLAIGSWMTLGMGSKFFSKVGATIESTIEKTAARDILTSLTDEGFETVGKDIFEQSAKEFTSKLDNIVIDDIGTTLTSGANEDISVMLDDLIYKGESKDIFTSGTNRVILDDVTSKIERTYGKEAATSFDKAVKDIDKSLSKSITKNITSVDELKTVLNVENIDSISSKTIKKLENNAVEAAKRAEYSTFNTIESKANNTVKNTTGSTTRKTEEAIGKAERRGEQVADTIDGSITNNNVLDDITKELSPEIKDSQQLIDDMIDQTGNRKLSRLDRKAKKIGSTKAFKNAEKQATKLFNKQFKGNSLTNKSIKLGSFLTVGAIGRTTTTAVESVWSGQNINQKEFWSDFFNTDGSDFTDAVPNISNYESIGDSTSKKVVQEQLESIADPGEVDNNSKNDEPKNPNDEGLLKSFTL